jgi:hypothetical protein
VKNSANENAAGDAANTGRTSFVESGFAESG